MNFRLEGKSDIKLLESGYEFFHGIRAALLDRGNGDVPPIKVCEEVLYNSLYGKVILDKNDLSTFLGMLKRTERLRSSETELVRRIDNLLKEKDGEMMH
jgi:hypothetical protein